MQAGEQGDPGSDPRIPPLWLRAADVVLLFGRSRLSLAEIRIALDRTARTAPDRETRRLAREAAIDVKRALAEINAAGILPIGRWAVLCVRHVPWYARPFGALLAGTWAAGAVAWAVLRGPRR